VEKVTLEDMGTPELLSKQGEPEHLLAQVNITI
jgi:hypothetical protein